MRRFQSFPARPVEWCNNEGFFVIFWTTTYATSLVSELGQRHGTIN